MLECFPWDLPCTLKDVYGEKTSALTDEYPFTSGMPKSTLTSEELAKTDYIIFLKYDLSLWHRGLNGQSIIGLQQRTSFHTLGYLVMGAEGFNDLY